MEDPVEDGKRDNMDDVLYEIKYIVNDRPHTVRWAGSIDILVAMQTFQNEFSELDSIVYFAIIEIYKDFSGVDIVCPVIEEGNDNDKS